MDAWGWILELMIETGVDRIHSHDELLVPACIDLRKDVHFLLL
jgi:hypothetical protein